MSKLILFLALGLTGLAAHADEQDDSSTESRAAVVRGECADGVPSSKSKQCFSHSASGSRNSSPRADLAQACSDTNTCSQNATPIPAGAQSDALKQ